MMVPKFLDICRTSFTHRVHVPVPATLVERKRRLAGLNLDLLEDDADTKQQQLQRLEHIIHTFCRYFFCHVGVFVNQE